MEPAGKSAHTLGKGGVAETVVGGALVRVHQHVVGFAKLLEFFLRVRVVRIFVRMIFYREFA